MLYIVPTPIGNLADITFRAVEVLKTVHRIAAEDTRHSKILLNHYGIQTGLQSFHGHSSDHKVEELADVARNMDVALISDAGMPGISDPAYRLIRRVIEENIPFTVLPGPTAFVNALVASGLPAHDVIFLGFLPLKKGRKTLFESLREEERTVVFYESPHRVLKTLSEMLNVLSERPVAACRELTKMHEEVLRGSLGELLKHFEAVAPRGEFTMVLGGKKAPQFPPLMPAVS